MLPGHGSAFLLISRRHRARLSPLYTTPQSLTRQRHKKCQNTRVVFDHPRVSCPLRLSSTSPVDGTNKYNPIPPHAAENRRKNTKMPPASPKKCFGTSWRCQRRSGRYLCPISTAPTPRESNETPWEVSRHWGHRKRQNMWVVKHHPRVSCPLRPPSDSQAHGTNKGNTEPPHAARSRQINVKTLLASPKSALALPGDVSDDRVQLCARFRWRPPPGSPMGLPGKFQG